MKNKFANLEPRLRTAIRRRLLAWYARSARDLPWRRTGDPYAIWVSEIMLQQTQVDTVIPYYRKFLRAFPNVRALARAREDHVLKMWEGLGYYRRARHLHAASRLLVSRQAGRLPQSAAAWQALPGVGAYTAGAIASIALGEPAPILDGNVKRVWARLFTISGSLENSATVETLWAVSRELVPEKQPGAFNQAVMELGALVCLPRKPECGKCPVRAHCRAFASGRPEQWPRVKPAEARPHRLVVAGVLQHQGKLLIGKRPEGGLLGGLWEFPGGGVEPGETLEQALQREFQEETGMKVRAGKAIASVEHAYTHFSITLHAFYVQRVSGTPRPLYHQHLRWVEPDEIRRYAFPKANLKIIGKLGGLTPVPAPRES